MTLLFVSRLIPGRGHGVPSPTLGQGYGVQSLTLGQGYAYNHLPLVVNEVDVSVEYHGRRLIHEFIHKLPLKCIKVKQQCGTSFNASKSNNSVAPLSVHQSQATVWHLFQCIKVKQQCGTSFSASKSSNSVTPLSVHQSQTTVCTIQYQTLI